MVKQLLRTSAESNDAAISRIGEATAGVAFFATPNTGSRLASLAATSLGFLGPLGMAYRGSDVLRELRANSAQIRSLNDWFRNHAANRPPTERLHVKAWCEKLGPLGIRIVDETSANPGIADVTILGVNADHFSICKPTRSDDRRILNVLELCAQPSAQSSSDRHEETAPHRTHLQQRRRTFFVGRDAEKRQLMERLAGGGRAAICAVAGMGGVGKTELALQVAGALGEAAFPDGIVTVNLMGTPDAATLLPPLTPEAAMRDVLAQLDPTAQPPAEPSALARAYAQALVGKCLLLILDNARDTAQVTPLVPPEPVALVVTSRHRIDLPEGLTLDLDTLDPADAVALLQEEIGAARRWTTACSPASPNSAATCQWRCSPSRERSSAAGPAHLSNSLLVLKLTVLEALLAYSIACVRASKRWPTTIWSCSSDLSDWCFFQPSSRPKLQHWLSNPI